MLRPRHGLLDVLVDLLARPRRAASGPLHVEDHAAGVVLVDDVGRHDLHRHRPPKLCAIFAASAALVATPLLQQRQPVALEDRPALGLGQVSLVRRRRGSPR